MMIDFVDRFCLFSTLFLTVNFVFGARGAEQTTKSAVFFPVDVLASNELIPKQNSQEIVAIKQPGFKDYEKAGPDVRHLIQDAREFADSSVGFWHAFVAAVSVIIVSELGDKTWFIAAIMAMRHSRLTVFFGAMAALALMTILSGLDSFFLSFFINFLFVGGSFLACLGWATQIIPRKLTFYVSTVLFALFGLKMLREGYLMSPNEGQEEYEEAQAEVKKKEDEIAKQLENDMAANNDVEKGLGGTPKSSSMRLIFRFVSKIFLESFTLTFLAEWGDRSQLTTIILAARENVPGVTIGGIVGHGVCTGIAVLGGRIVAQRISVRTVTIIGGVVFIVFALSALVMNPDS